MKAQTIAALPLKRREFKIPHLFRKVVSAIRRDSERADRIYREVEAMKQETIQKSIRYGLMRNL